MQTYRVFKTVNYWVDVEVEDDQTEDEAMDAAMDIDQCNWDSEIVDEGFILLDGEEDDV
jgi:hypothetical protein